MRSWWLVAALAGTGACGFSPDGPATPDAGGDDADRDGVRDADDNCIDVVNPDQHDEDRDDVGDVCDNCPHVANADQANVGETGAGAVADQAGDACDPFPAVGGNDILMFESFATMSGWASTGPGAWSLVSDSLGDGVVQSRPDVTTTLYAGVPLAGAVIDTLATPMSGNVGAGFGFGPVALFTPSVLHGVGYACDLFDDAVVPLQARSEYLESQNVNVLAADPGPDTSPLGQPWRIRVMASTGRADQSCQVTGPGPVELQALSTDDRMLPGRVALHAFNVSVRFDHVVVFSVDP